MAARGSAIGASLTGGLGAGNIGGSATSVRSPTRGAAYSTPVQPKLGRVHHYVWLLVFVELAALVALRYVFRDHRGG